MKRSVLLFAALALGACERDSSAAPLSEPELRPALDQRAASDDDDGGDDEGRERGGVVYTLSNATTGLPAR